MAAPQRIYQFASPGCKVVDGERLELFYNAHGHKLRVPTREKAQFVPLRAFHDRDGYSTLSVVGPHLPTNECIIEKCPLGGTLYIAVEILRGRYHTWAVSGWAGTTIIGAMSLFLRAHGSSSHRERAVKRNIGRGKGRGPRQLSCFVGSLRSSQAARVFAAYFV